jgi:hypothetical protein
MRRFPIRESRPQRVSGWERGAFAWFSRNPHLPDSGRVIPSLVLATVVLDRWQEAIMIHRTLLLHHRLVRGAITTLVTVGTALLFGYLILRARL